MFKVHINQNRIVQILLGILIITSAISIGYISLKFGDFTNYQKNKPFLNIEVPYQAPEFDTNVTWLNSDPLEISKLKRKVILIDFWSYECKHCLTNIAKLKEWRDIYSQDDLVVIGVHTPEFSYQKNVENVSQKVSELGINYPVVVDSENLLWNDFGVQFWPTTFLIDRKGNIRHYHTTSYGFSKTKVLIEELIKEKAD